MANSNNEDPRQKSILEQHIQTILAALVLAAILWVARGVNSTGTAITEIKGEVALINLGMGYMKDSITNLSNDRYTKTDSERDRRETDSKIEAMDRRLQELEKIVRDNQLKINGSR